MSYKPANIFYRDGKQPIEQKPAGLAREEPELRQAVGGQEGDAEETALFVRALLREGLPLRLPRDDGEELHGADRGHLRVHGTHALQEQLRLEEPGHALPRQGQEERHGVRRVPEAAARPQLLLQPLQRGRQRPQVPHAPPPARLQQQGRPRHRGQGRRLRPQLQAQHPAVHRQTGRRPLHRLQDLLPAGGLQPHRPRRRPHPAHLRLPPHLLQGVRDLPQGGQRQPALPALRLPPAGRPPLRLARPPPQAQVRPPRQRPHLLPLHRAAGGGEPRGHRQAQGGRQPRVVDRAPEGLPQVPHGVHGDHQGQEQKQPPPPNPLLLPRGRGVHRLRREVAAAADCPGGSGRAGGLLRDVRKDEAMICSINYIGMGNTNHFRDPDFMLNYLRLQKEFKEELPLFDVEHIKFPLSTKNMKIVDATGRRVKLAGGNWSGGHAKRHCVGGLDRRPLRQLCRQIRTKFGMNHVRLTFSLQLFRKNNFIEKDLIKANPDLFGKTAKEIFDITIRVLTEEGIMVYLNNHTSKSQWCCDSNDGDGLWWNQDYSEEDFFTCLEELARKYRTNPRVIGIDLRNEIRSTKLGSPTWGDGNRQTDWKLAAQTIGNRIQKIAPHWLIIVGGIDYQLNLRGVMEHPIELEVPNKLVYSGHFYGFSWGPSVIWSLMSEEWFREKLFNDQVYVRGLGVPFLVGEFGNNSRDDSWRYFLRYLREFDLDWTYWCLDGYKCDKQEEETYGVWDFHFLNPRNPQLLEDMKKAARPLKGIDI